MLRSGICSPGEGPEGPAPSLRAGGKRDERRSSLCCKRDERRSSLCCDERRSSLCCDERRSSLCCDERRSSLCACARNRRVRGANNNQRCLGPLGSSRSHHTRTLELVQQDGPASFKPPGAEDRSTDRLEGSRGPPLAGRTRGVQGDWTGRFGNRVAGRQRGQVPAACVRPVVPQGVCRACARRVCLK